MLNQMFIDFNNPTSGNLAIGAAAVSAPLPANTKILGITTVANAHIRLGNASVVAVVTDPLVMPQSQIVFLTVPGDATTISAIQDPATPNTGNLNFFSVKEA